MITAFSQHTAYLNNGIGWVASKEPITMMLCFFLMRSKLIRLTELKALCVERNWQVLRSYTEPIVCTHFCLLTSPVRSDTTQLQKRSTFTLRVGGNHSTSVLLQSCSFLYMCYMCLQSDSRALQVIIQQHNKKKKTLGGL